MKGQKLSGGDEGAASGSSVAGAEALLTGLDVSTDCSKAVGCLTQAGVQFVIRYYARMGSKKNLTRSEAITLSSESLDIAVVWESGRPTSASYFSYADGVDDGTSACNSALKLGQPAGTPIYFAVDYDATDADISGGINDYFRGIRDGFRTIGGGSAEHPIGVYGSGAVCSWLLARKAVEYTWLAQSRGWRGYNTFQTWNIRQHAERTLCELDVDQDEARPGFGGFRVT